jgi:hypothetical protein
MSKQWDAKTKYKSGALVAFKDKQYKRISDDELIEKCETTSPDKPIYLWKLVSDTEQSPEITSASEDKIPGKQLDLKNWYLTLPIGKPRDPLCIYQPDLDKYVHPKFFFANEENNAVVFISHCGGVTTKGSKYSRSELRECTNNGKDKASWDTEKGKHTMTFTACVQNVPKVKPSVIVGQIHATTQYLVLVKLIKGKLQVQHDGKIIGTLDDKFSLGKRFTVKIEVYNNATYIYYNDVTNAKVKLNTKAKDCYFKVGSYNQSSTSTGDKPEETAEVWVYNLKVEHTF